MRVIAIEPHGFCAGVTGAIRKALTLAGSRDDVQTSKHPNDQKIYCLHELVHNEIVVADLQARGFVFVDDVNEVPEGATVLFSAHGVSPAVRAGADARKLKVVDATCPFVAKVHKAAKEFAERGLQVVVIGKPDHAEVKGITGEVPNSIVIDSFPSPVLPPVAVAGSDRTPGDPSARPYPQGGSEPRSGGYRGESAPCRLGVVSQTTMNADEVAEIVDGLRRHCDVETMAEVCNATKVRQDAVKAFAGDALLVLGSANSSNTRRLCEVARCARVFRAGTLDEVKALDLAGVGCLGVTSGASTPETFFREAMEFLNKEQA